MKTLTILITMVLALTACDKDKQPQALQSQQAMSMPMPPVVAKVVKKVIKKAKTPKKVDWLKKFKSECKNPPENVEKAILATKGNRVSVILVGEADFDHGGKFIQVKDCLPRWYIKALLKHKKEISGINLVSSVDDTLQLLRTIVKKEQPDAIIFVTDGFERDRDSDWAINSPGVRSLPQVTVHCTGKRCLLESLTNITRGVSLYEIEVDYFGG